MNAAIGGATSAAHTSVTPSAGHEALLHASAINHLDFSPRVRAKVVIFIANDEGNSFLVQLPQVGQVSPKDVKAFWEEGLEKGRYFGRRGFCIDCIFGVL